MNFIIAVTVVLALLVFNEVWWHQRVHGEASRKFVHITVGTFVALWPLLLTWSEIELLSLLFVIAVLISRRFNIFKAIHAVERPTWGELYFGAAVGLVALITHEPAIYAVALLHMSLADGLAAVVGQTYGKHNTYKIFGAKKSWVGTLTFFVVSSVILVAFAIQQQLGFVLWVPLVAAVATMLENVAVRGLDNLLMPVVIAVLLAALV